MKKKSIIIVLAVLLGGSTVVNAAGENTANRNNSSDTSITSATKQQEPRLWFTIGATGGMMSGSMPSQNLYASSNANGIIPTSGVSSGSYGGVTAGFKYFFGKQRNIGVGLGVLYTSMQANLVQDSFHIRYKETDKWGSQFAQLLTVRSGNIKETDNLQMLSIPLTLILKIPVSEKVTFELEPGILYNVSLNSKLKSESGVYDLEAEYDFTGSSSIPVNGGNYFNATTTSNAWLITRKQAVAHGSTDGGSAYLTTLQSQGFSVGSMVTPTSTNNNTTFKAGTIGFIFKPSFIWHIGKSSNLGAGMLITASSYSQASSNYRIFDRNMVYNSIFGGVTKMNVVNVGFTISYQHAIF